MIAREPWLVRLKRTYIGNPTATRDLRVQLRGNRAVILFSIYLIVMGLFLMLTYESAMRFGSTSLATAQSSLEGFYQATLICLGVVITLVAPAMGAFAVVQEKQRRSLDLVFSAPVEPKMYLVGKLISSYRYVWLLLILSLPFCAVSVTLGGATWSQLFITFILFSCYGLVCAAFGLLLSVYCNKPLPAIIWTYTAVGAYLCIASMLLGMTSYLGGMGRSAPSPIGTLSPWSFHSQYGESALILTKEVPLWIISVALHLVVVKFVILSAGSQLGASDTKEIAGLRIHGLIYAGLVSWLSAVATDSIVRQFFRIGVTGSATSLQEAFGRGAFVLLTVLACLAVPYLSTMSSNDLRRFHPDGVFKSEEIFSGKVSGNTPYLLLLFTVVAFTFTAACAYYGQGVASIFYPSSGFTSSPMTATTSSMSTFTAGSAYIAFVFLAFGFWFIAHSFGLIMVSKRGTVSQGRTASAFMLIFLILIPTAFLSIVDPEHLQSGSGLWSLNPLTGLLITGEMSLILTFAHAASLTVIATLLYSVASTRMRKRAQGINP
jgi:hypothetical protein